MISLRNARLCMSNMDIILLTVAVLVTLLVPGTCDIVTKKMVTLKGYEKGFRFPYNTSVITYTESRIGCVKDCSSEDTCNSVNMKRRDGKFVCEMSREATGFVFTNKLVKDVDYIYYEKKTPTCQNGGIWNSSSTQCDDCLYLTWGTFCENYMRDCTDAKARFLGIYNDIRSVLIQPLLAHLVCCDLSWGAHLLAQRSHLNALESFDRGWEDYKGGFGDLQNCSDDFFLGLEKIHLITRQGNYLLLIWLDFEGAIAGGNAFYNGFTVGDESTSYVLQHNGFFSGDTDIDNGFDEADTRINGAPFATPDRKDNNNCSLASGWWFNPNISVCSVVNLHVPKANMKWPRAGKLTVLDFYDFKLERK